MPVLVYLPGTYQWYNGTMVPYCILYIWDAVLYRTTGTIQLGVASDSGEGGGIRGT